MELPSAEEILSQSDQLRYISELNAKGRGLLCKQASVTRVAKRGRILSQHEHRWLTFLVDGELSVTNEKNQTLKIIAKSRQANQPVFSGDMTEASAQAVLSSILVRFEKEQFELLLRQQQKSSHTIDVKVDDADNLVFNQILEAFESERLPLPSSPDVAFKIKNAINQKNFGLAEVSQIIQQDQVLAARLMQVANSAMYRRGADAMSLPAALGRLGLEATQKLSFVLAIKQIFNSKSAISRKYLADIYNHSTRISAFCYLLAKEVPGLDTERALLAGLIYNLGSIPILYYADQCGLFEQREALNASVEKLSPLIGGWVMEKFNFDQELCLVPETCQLWQREDEGKVDYSTLVTAALLYHNAQKDESDSNLPSLDSVPIGRLLKKQGLDLMSDHSLMERVNEEIAGIQQLLC